MIDYSHGFRGSESPHILRPLLTLIHSYRQYLGTYFIPITSEDKDVIEVVFPKKMIGFDEGHTFNFERFDPN